MYTHTHICGRDISAGIAIRYWLEGPGIESRWGRGFLQFKRLAPVPTQPPIPGLSRVQSGLGVLSITQSYLMPKLKKQ
jgi:hypothetical protein